MDETTTVTHDTDALQAENDALRTELNARREADADRAISAAIRRGVIPPKSTAIQAKWKARILADPENAELLASMAGNPALHGKVTMPTAHSKGRAEIIQCSYDDALRGYIEAKTPREKGLVYRTDINARLDKGEIIPFGDLKERLPLDASNTLGTLVGNIISQRTLAILFSKRPLLKAFVTDFSDQGAVLNQTVKTRAIGLPTVQDFGGAVSNRADVDYDITLSFFKEVRFQLLVTEYSATGRDLVREQSQALAVSLGNYLVDSTAALITTAFTSAATVPAAEFDFTAVIAQNKALNDAGVPDMDRFALINGAVASSIRNDEIVMAEGTRDKTSAYAHWQNLEGFDDIFEYPSLPTTNNLNGFWFNRNALLLAARLPADPTALTGAGYPGRLQAVTDPVTNFSVLSNQWVDQSTLTINDRLITIFGAARGLIGAGIRTVES